jgi:hypothetical protein
MKIELKVIPDKAGGKRWMIFDSHGYLHFEEVAKEGEMPAALAEELLKLSLGAGAKRREADYWENCGRSF